MSILLIHPPISKASEPPAGIATLHGFLPAHGISSHVLDLNMEGIRWMIEHPPPANDRWSRRAVKMAAGHLRSIKDLETFKKIDRYKRAVHDLSHVLDLCGTPYGVRLNLSNYQHRRLSPLRSADLYHAAENPEENPFYPLFARRIVALLEETGSQCVGISLNFLHQALTVFAILGFLRRSFPEVKVVLGGGLVTSWMSRPHRHDLFHDLADHLVKGPGEEPLLAFLKGAGHDTAHCAPDYGGLPALRDYLSPVSVLPYSASSGCYWSKCAFCPERAEGNPYRPIPPRQVLEDLGQLKREFKPGLIHFLDNAMSPSLLKALAEAPPGVPWYGFARVHEAMENLEFCHGLRRAGCVMLQLGLESGDEGVIEREGKGTGVALASRVLRNLAGAGIAVYAYLLFGTPSETERQAQKTLEFVVEHHDAIDFMNVAIFNMPIHSPDGQEFHKHAHYDGDLSLYTGFTHPGGWNRKQVREFVEKRFKRQKEIGAVLGRVPPYFTSNHASFFKHSPTLL